MGEMLTKDEKFVDAAERFKTAALHENEKSEDYDDDIMKHWYNAATAYVQVANSIRLKSFSIQQQGLTVVYLLLYLLKGGAR